MAGDYEAIPEDFGWIASAAFAHFIDGYALSSALGLGELGDFANQRAAEARSTGVWSGSATELWLCLFYEHRRARHTGQDPEGEERVLVDALCQALRTKLLDEHGKPDGIKLVRHRPAKDPRDLHVLDPACGSGHFLLYTFDLLVTIYEEAWNDSPVNSEVTGRTLREDYPSTELLRQAIPALILAHNLHGVDIDARCAQIAQLALWMRAQRAFSDSGISRAERPLIRRSNIVVAEPLVTGDAMLNEFLGKLGDAELSRVFAGLVETLKVAGDLGLLLRVEALTARRPHRGQSGELFSPEARIRNALSKFVAVSTSLATTRRLFAEDAAQGVGLLKMGEKKFDIVLMNPPFGSGSARAKREFEKAYPRTKNDVYAAFVERGIELLHARGRLGAITSRTGFFLSRFKAWREDILLAKAPPVVFADLGFGVLDSAMVETAAYCLEVLP